MDKFAQILRQLPIRDTYLSSGHATHFKAQVNFDITLFEGMIYDDVVDKWLNLLEGYFRSTNFLVGKILYFHSYSLSHMLMNVGILTLTKGPWRNL
jgi:hypothetical protein